MRKLTKLGPISITLIYMMVSLTWILTSDLSIEFLFSKPELLNKIQTLKGSFFVLISSLLLFLLLHVFKKQNSELAEKLKQSYQEIFSLSPAAQIIFDLETKNLIEVNDKALSILGRKHTKTRLSDFFEPSKYQEFSQWLNNQEGKNIKNNSFKTEALGTNGTSHNIELNLRYINGWGVLYFQKLGENWLYLKNINQAERLFSLMRELSGVGFWEANLSNNTLRFCTNAKAMLETDLPANEDISLTSLENRSDLKPLAKAVEWCNVKSNVRYQQELEHLNHSGEKCYLVSDAQRIQFQTSEIVAGTLIDISDHKAMENQLRNREMQLNELIEKLPEGIIIVQKRLIVYANAAAIEMLGYTTAKDLDDKNILDYIPVHKKSEGVNFLHSWERQQPRKTQYQKIKIKRSNSDVFMAEVTGRPLIYNNHESIQLVIRDLTHDINMQDQLRHANERLRALSISTLRMLERERKRIAGELHDDVGQSLTAIKLATKWLQNRTVNEELTSKLADINTICEDVMEKVRDLSLMLRPIQLDSLGLPAAIKWQAERLLSNQSIEFVFNDKKYREVGNKEVETIAFRIVQESLTNIVKHAEANTVKVTLQSTGHDIIIQVVDDGIGFDIDQQNNTLGLVNMKERVELANGSINIDASPKVGTEINVTLPYGSLKTPLRLVKA